MGIGRMIDIVHRGIEARKKMIELFCLAIADVGLKLGFACYMIAQISLSALGGFIGLLILMGSIVVYINSFALASRAERKDIEIGLTRRFIRLLMSRLEVLHSDKVAHEASQQTTDVERLLQVNRGVNNNLFLMYQMPVNITYLLTAGI
jgi:hypothetical protein